MSTISTRKVGALDCLSKGIPDNLWCSNCSYSNNLTLAEKIKPCCHPLILKDNSTIFQSKKYHAIQDYLIVELEPPVKKKKQTRPSSNIIDDIILSPIQAADDLNLSIQDCDSVSSLTSLSSDTFEDDLSFPATEFVSEDNSSVNHQFVNDSEVYNNSISQVDAVVNFALTLNFS